MAFFGEDDIEVMLADMGVDVTLGADTVKALLNIGDEEIYPGGTAPVLGKDIEVFLKTNSLPGLVKGASIVVDGSSYIAGEPRQYGDGAMTRVPCRVDTP